MAPLMENLVAKCSAETKALRSKEPNLELRNIDFWTKKTHLGFKVLMTSVVFSCPRCPNMTLSIREKKGTTTEQLQFSQGPAEMIGIFCPKIKGYQSWGCDLESQQMDFGIFSPWKRKLERS